MKLLKLLILILIFCFTGSSLAQVTDNNKYDPSFPILIKPVNHDPNFKNFPENSFYESRNDWRHIIDSVWGPGLPLSDKLNIFNTFANTLHDQFDGFLSLGINWDSLRSYYQLKIDDSTSRGGFSAILSDLTLDLRDYHTQAYDVGVRNTPLNPGVPLMALSGFLTVEHFGAVITVLPDNRVCVIRAVSNHPLGLEPGDIILGYEGVPWSYLVDELQENELPSFGSLGGALSVIYHQKLICAGMNWHLFDTIDILKYSGDTVHLPTSLLVGLNATQMLNNEQVAIPGISFPNYFNNQFVSYGIINNTNIGYIYLYQEYPQAIVDQQFFEAVAALQNTDGLIIDMRLNFGGWAFFAQAFEILFNDSHLTIEDAHRCNVNTFEMCPVGNASWYQISNNTPGYYDRPIAVLLGPTCVSMGDLTAQRFRYHPMIRFFGEAPAASLGDNTGINTWPTFNLHYSFGDMFHVSEPGNYLNRVEFPIDYPVWHNAFDIANGKDAVVEKALTWMDSLVFPQNILVEKYYYSGSADSVRLSTIIENPNSHQLSARAYLKTLEGMLIDSVDLFKQVLKVDGENWRADFTLPASEEFYRVAVTVFDETESEHFTVPSALKITTAGPSVLDSISWTQLSTFFYSVKPFVKNQSTVTTITNASVKLICNDPWVTSINPSSLALPDIPPGAIVSTSTGFTVGVDTSIFPDYFNFEVEILSNGWPFWTDSMLVPPIAIISINPTELNFGGVVVDSSATKSFTITNYGDEDLVISNITSSEPVFTVNITSAVVLPDSSQDVEVTFTPTGLLSFNGKLEITHNAAGSPDSVIVTGEGVTGVEEELQPLTYSLEQNYPNPFNPSTTIKYSVPELSKVKLTLFNLLGEEVKTLVNEVKSAGNYTAEFTAASLPSGVYFYQLKAGEYVNTKKMILLK